MSRSRRTRTALVALLLAALSVMTGCSGDDGGEDNSPAGVLAAAKKKLDETSGVSLRLTTDKLPKGVDGVLDASGVGTHQPAFDGTLKALVNNITIDVPVVAAEGQVCARLPFTKTFNAVEPGDYGAPDPADLMDPSTGLSAWLTQTKDVKQGDKTRDGDQVLTTYTGTLPGAAVAKTIPSADAKGDFDATYRIDDSGQLVQAAIAGPFYKEGAVDYAFTISQYGTDKDIRAPKECGTS